MAPRYPLQARATLRPARQAARLPASVQPAPAVVENLSQAGAFVATNQPFAEGDSVELEVVLPQGVLAATGVVARKDARGVGLRFDARPEAERAIASAVRGIASRRRRVLVVNEDDDARRTLAEALEARGFAVVTVGDGLSGLRALSSDIVSVDAVVTHLAPRMDGEEFVRRLRQAGGHAALAIVVVDSAASAERLRGAGVDGVFAKEARPEAIAAAVDRAAELRRRGALSAAPAIALAARG
jgi:CheY-like chemotaxis protein